MWLLILFVWFCLAVNRLEERQERLGKQQLEESLHRTAAACYASEGVYPPDVFYMEEHYGLHFDKERYLVRYEIFASNLMPEITVLEAAP